jgi:hypothetical protein
MKRKNKSAGQPSDDTQGRTAGAPANGGGHRNSDTQAISAPTTAIEDGQWPHDTHNAGAILALRELQAQRVATIRAEIRLANQVRALVRRVLGWQADLPEKERERINGMASKLVKAIRQNKPIDPEHTAAADTVSAFVLGMDKAMVEVESYRDQLEKQMTAHSKALPVWSAWCEGVRGFGAMSLAVIVGEAGDLCDYANPGKLWKRMGLAPKASYRMVCKDGTEGFTIPKRRRSCMWNVGDVFVKVGADEYRQLYDQRKAYEHERDPEMSKMHAHRRAQRYMEKRLLRDLWREWNKAAGHTPSDTQCESAAAAV